MLGKVIHYVEDTKSGLISGEDGGRYSFSIFGWIGNKVPKPGMRVDFENKGKEAVCICPAS